ncbi:7SK snRNA methylphosphate capping enzyme [Alosa pseudoharengus]|uniref:7SK snRNA methylphosphate capping enzyme n=1 Tax=Alosa pseudoharengus TaxID=34774 RepID=UPI003F8B32BD
MIEMSVDKETVLPPQGRSVGSHQQSMSSFNNNNSSGETPAKHISKDGSATEVEMGSTANTVEVKTSNTKDLEQSDVQAQESNSGLQHNAQQPKVNKRRSTMSTGFKHPIFGKKRRRANSESNPVLPTNFQLGGNIFDPLNLNSLLDEEVNRALNAETPKSSPLPLKSRDPVEILIPRDITDPLNLNCGAKRNTGDLISPLKSSGRRRHRNRHHGGAGGGPAGLGVAQLDFSEAERSVEGAPATAEGVPSSSLSHPLPGVSAGSTLPEGAALLNTSPSTDHNPSTVNNPGEDLRTSSGPSVKPQPAQRLSGGHAVPADGSDVALAPTAAGPALPHLPGRQRKRRRVSSRSDNSRASSTTPAKQARPEKGRRAPGPVKHGQPFQTPVVTSGSRTISRRMPPNHRGTNQQPKKKFQYGNYTKYYGYRNPGVSDDPRMDFLRPEWFQGRVVLDLGCNTGHLTMFIAKQCLPSRIVGLDIDGGLIHAARQNIRYYLSEIQAREARRNGTEDQPQSRGMDDLKDGMLEEQREQRKDAVEEGRRGRPGADRGLKSNREESGGNCFEQRQREVERSNERTSDKKEGGDGGGGGPPKGSHTFPVSLRISRGPIAAPPLPKSPSQQQGSFPANVSFVTGNYVVENDQFLLTQKEEYDVILCLSVTKWVHLNWGDAGLKRLFHRVYRHLRPGGIFILEPQPWSSYGRRKRLTDTIYKNYVNIRLKPDDFSTYLTSEVGFNSYELIGIPMNLSRGFQRPIYLFHKGPSRK